MNANIALLLAQDGIANGLIYALLALALLLVFVVTRVLFVPAGEFVMLGALTLATLQKGLFPPTVWLLATLGCLMAVSETWIAWRAGEWRPWRARMLLALGAPLLGGLLAAWLAPQKPPLGVQIGLTLLLVAPIAPILYRVAFRPLASASVLVLLFAAMAVHYALMGLGLYFFGAEGVRTPPFVPGRIDVGFTRVSWHLLIVLGVAVVLMALLWLLFTRTLRGKALRATAVNRVGARLVGIRPESAGLAAFAIAGFIATLSGVLIAPLTAIYYDSGFLVALRGFVGAVVGGMASFPLAVAGALLVGLVESYAAFYQSAFKEALVFALLIPILMWRSAVEGGGQHEEEE